MGYFQAKYHKTEAVRIMFKVNVSSTFDKENPTGRACL